MLSALELENFKGIADRQRIDFAPLTLLFGANSAGKSTILQALLYLHEVVERGDADVDRTELSGAVLELGGFKRLVHRHETNRTIVVRAEFATPGGLDCLGRELPDFPFPDLDDDIEAAWLEIVIQYRQDLRPPRPVVESLRIGVPGHDAPLAALDLVGAMRTGDPLYARVNLRHPVLRGRGDEVYHAWRDISVPEPLWHGGIDPASGNHVIGLDDVYALDSDLGPMPLFAISRSRESAVPPLGEPLRVITADDLDEPDRSATQAQVRAFIEMTVLGTASQLLATLRDAAYVGPLRTVPPRGFLYERAGRLTSWADGLAAWDLLLSDRGTLVKSTNEWLTRLGAGCRVVVQQLVDGDALAQEFSDESVDRTVRRLLLDTGTDSLVHPSEVGAGISQVIPVVVAALQGEAGVVLVEQPEIHVHPALQVGLGDLLIEAATRGVGRRTSVVETHSEHLLLRVMRRIRETTEGTLPEGSPPATPADVMVLFIERTAGGTIMRRMPLNDRGELVKAWPGGFFEEGLREVF